MNSEEIQQLKEKVSQTLQKKRLRLRNQEDPKSTSRTLEIPNKGSIQGGNVTTSKINDIE